MHYTIHIIAEITGGKIVQLPRGDAIIDQLVYDSRKVHAPAHSLFFAIKGNRRDGHQFIPELYKRGVRNFIISESIDTAVFLEGNFIETGNTLAALQQLAAFHRNEMVKSKKGDKIPVIGITGSNGKTIVKEWLYQLLHQDYDIVRNPKSYNSQIGVPLSVWQMNSHHTLAIFEAGISRPGEMAKLEAIIKPTFGILTNIGEAHNEGFTNTAQKFLEKTILFKNCDAVIGREKDFSAFSKPAKSSSAMQKILTWGNSDSCEFIITSIKKEKNNTVISLRYKQKEFAFEIPFSDDAGIENAVTCCCALLYFGYDPAVIAARMKRLRKRSMSRSAGC